MEGKVLYVPPILGQLLDFISPILLLFLGTDLNPMTHETWQSGQAIVVRVEIHLKTFIEKKI
jgi:hypothetical protein